MRLATLSRPFRKSLFAYLRKVMRPRQPDIDALERELQARRRAHRSTRETHARLRAARIKQLKHEVGHG